MSLKIFGIFDSAWYEIEDCMGQIWRRNCGKIDFFDYFLIINLAKLTLQSKMFFLSVFLTFLTSTRRALPCVLWSSIHHAIQDLDWKRLKVEITRWILDRNIQIHKLQIGIVICRLVLQREHEYVLSNKDFELDRMVYNEKLLESFWIKTTKSWLKWKNKPHLLV